VWYLPEIARRFGCTEIVLRETLFKETNMMYPELVTRPDLKVFLPPIGGLTIYIFGDPATIPDESVPLTVRVHDECNGSDVFGSDICTCRPYLTHAIEECIRTAQQGGAGVVIYYRKEGRSLGEVRSVPTRTFLQCLLAVRTSVLLQCCLMIQLGQCASIYCSAAVVVLANVMRSRQCCATCTLLFLNISLLNELFVRVALSVSQWSSILVVQAL
jgi:GTP cyclohydrolase II